MKKSIELPTFPENIHPALKEAFGYRFMHAALKYRNALLVILDDFKITPPQFAILRIVADSEFLNQATLGKELGHEKVAIVRMIDGLEELKLIKRHSGTNDKREKLIQITPAGKSALLKIKKRNITREKNFLAPLSESEALTLKKLIMKL